MNYRWLLNGNPVSNATNATLNLTNAQPASAGNYSVVVTNFSGAATSRVAVLRIKTSDFPLLFSDNFDADTSTNWNLFWGAANGIPDYTVDFAYDYGATPYTFNGVATNSTATVFQNLFPAARFETAGSPGKNWIEVEVRQTNNVILWLMDGIVIAQRTNSSSFTKGNIMLGLMDVFPSIANPARDCFVIYDNVRVENLAPPISFQNIARLPDGNISLALNSALGDSFALESSTNLAVWQPLASLLLTNNPLIFVDTNASTRAAVFYRGRR